MHIRKLALAAAVIAAIAPSLSNASPENAALNACARAFASSIASPGSAAPAFKVQYQGTRNAGVLADYYSPQYTFYLQAHDAKTGIALARATCSTDSHGTIMALTSTPLPLSGAALAAQL
jgi:hypothetical protein